MYVADMMDPQINDQLSNDSNARHATKSDMDSSEREESQTVSSVVFENIVPKSVIQLWRKNSDYSMYNQAHSYRQDFSNASINESKNKQMSQEYGDILLSHDVLLEDNRKTTGLARNDKTDSPELSLARNKWGIHLKPVNRKEISNANDESVNGDTHLVDSKKKFKPKNEFTDFPNDGKCIIDVNKLNETEVNEEKKLSVLERRRTFESQSLSNQSEFAQRQNEAPTTRHKAPTSRHEAATNRISLFSNTPNEFFYQPNDKSNSFSPTKDSEISSPQEPKSAISLHELLKQDELKRTVDVLDVPNTKIVEKQNTGVPPEGTSIKNLSTETNNISKQATHPFFLEQTSQSSLLIANPSSRKNVAFSSAVVNRGNANDTVISKESIIRTKISESVTTSSPSLILGDKSLSKDNLFSEIINTESIPSENTIPLNYEEGLEETRNGVDSIHSNTEKLNGNDEQVLNNQDYMTSSDDSLEVLVDIKESYEANSKAPTNGDMVKIIETKAKTAVTYNKLGQVVIEDTSPIKNVEFKEHNSDLKLDKDFSDGTDTIQRTSSVALPSVQRQSLPTPNQNRRVGKLIIMTGEQRNDQLRQQRKSPDVIKKVGTKDANSSPKASLKGFALTFVSNELEESEDCNNQPVPEIVFNQPVSYVKSIMVDNKINNGNSKQRKKLKVTFSTSKLITTHSYPSEASFYDSPGKTGNARLSLSGLSSYQPSSVGTDIGSVVQREHRRIQYSNTATKDSPNPVLRYSTDGVDFNQHQNQEVGHALLF